MRRALFNAGFLGPIGPIGPLGPIGPIGPLGPLGPLGPIRPIRPIRPIGPISPKRTIRPISPISPIGPIRPIRPKGPIGPRKPLLLAVIALTCALPALAGDFTLNASAAYDDRQYDTSGREGIEQRLTLGWRRTFFTPISFRLLFRTEDFRGTEENGTSTADSHTQSVQPIAELSYVVGGFTAAARHDTIFNRAQLDDQSTRRTTERTSVTAGWARAGFPTFSVTGQRHRVDQPWRTVEDNTAAATVSYTRGGLLVSGVSQRGRQLDEFAGYERTSQTNGALLDWRGDLVQNRLSASVSGNANLASYSQRATAEGGTRIPFPVIISRALYAVDDTPEDSRDHPPIGNTALIDGSLNITSGVSLGPDAVSYQNLTLDLGRTETLDEVRLVVRDERGDPVKRVGLITFDVYTSVDGQLWTPLAGAATRWDAAVSYYEITFAETRSRWFKVVTFGVNPEPTLLTEIQAFYHRALAQGHDRETTQKLYGGQVGLTATPTSRLMLRYGGDYQGTTVEDTASIARTQNELRHDLAAEVRFGRGMTLGAAVSQRSAEATALPDESDRSYNAFFRAVPSRRFDLGLDFTRRDSERSFDAYTIDTIALHSKLRVLKALSFSLDAGQDSFIAHDLEGADSERQYVDLRSDAQLYPSLRLQLSLTTQRTTTPSIELPLFGRRYDRAEASVVWNPSPLLLLHARYDWVSSEDRSALTQQYFVDWTPLQGGSVTISASHQEDFDPYLDRRSSRTTLQPRWIINRFMALDINYFMFKTQIGDRTSRQRTLYASLNVTRK